MTEYRDKCALHLEHYAAKHGLPIGGDHKGNGKEYGHILKVSRYLSPKGTKELNKDEQYEKIVSYNLLENVSPDLYKKKEAHSMAHYLTSSQVLCYNFFRALMDEEAHPLQGLIDLLGQHGIAISRSALCEFEYNPPFYGKDGRRESSEIDFHINDSDGTEVFFEIKYTEHEFGKWERPKESNYKNFYEPMIAQCKGLYSERIAYNDSFKADYQLYRNALRVKSKDIYTVFLYPRGNAELEGQYQRFKSMIKMENNIQVWYWEDIVSKELFPLLYEKYFETYPEEISHHRSLR